MLFLEQYQVFKAQTMLNLIWRSFGLYVLIVLISIHLTLAGSSNPTQYDISYLDVFLHFYIASLPGNDGIL